MLVGALSSLFIGCLLQGALCQAFEVTIPKSIEILNGSCVTIPCSFVFESKYEAHLDNTCKAIWKNYKNKKAVFDSSEKTGTNGKLTGRLTEKDCTTTLNNLDPGGTNKYFFRIECRKKAKFEVKTVVEILLKDDPPRPTLTPSTVTVREGSSVSLNCSAQAPCLSHPPTLTWTPGLGPSQEMLQENQDKTKVLTSVVNFTASHLHHAKSVSCTAAYSKQDGSTESATSERSTLNISFAPQILPTSSDCTTAADQLSCSCETVGNPSPTVQWYVGGLPVRRSDRFAISHELLNDTGVRSFITVNRTHWKELATLLCRSSNSLGSASQRFCVNSLEPQTSVESHGQATLSIFIIITVGVLTAALVCALLFAVCAQRIDCHSPTKNQCLADTNTTDVMNTGLMSIAIEEDIYVNVTKMRTLDDPNTHQEHQQIATKSSEKENDGGSDVIYSGVSWKSKKKKEECTGDGNSSCSSYLEEGERCMEGGMCRNYESNTLEMGRLHDNTVTGDPKKAQCHVYAKVQFRENTSIHK